VPEAGPAARPGESVEVMTGVTQEAGESRTVADGSRAAKMDAIRQRALVCERCPHLAGSRTQVVFGVGDIEAPLMFVGEAPGADEDRQGEPFVGRAGELLTRVIQTMGLDRDRVYIANIVK
jgi:DNA polymerase